MRLRHLQQMRARIQQVSDGTLCVFCSIIGSRQPCSALLHPAPVLPCVLPHPDQCSALPCPHLAGDCGTGAGGLGSGGHATHGGRAANAAAAANAAGRLPRPETLQGVPLLQAWSTVQQAGAAGLGREEALHDPATCAIPGCRKCAYWTRLAAAEAADAAGASPQQLQQHHGQVQQQLKQLREWQAQVRRPQPLPSRDPQRPAVPTPNLVPAGGNPAAPTAVPTLQLDSRGAPAPRAGLPA